MPDLSPSIGQHQHEVTMASFFTLSLSGQEHVGSVSFPNIGQWQCKVRVMNIASLTEMGSSTWAETQLARGRRSNSRQASPSIGELLLTVSAPQCTLGTTRGEDNLRQANNFQGLLEVATG